MEDSPSRLRFTTRFARFEKRSSANTDPTIDMDCELFDRDRFLTLASTDGGDGNACDWVLWTQPELVILPSGR